MNEKTVTFTGQVVTLAYEDGKLRNYAGCEDCECQLHDEEPAPRGQCITIRLDDESTKVWVGPITATGVAR